jgi:hypothetical protein
LRKPARIAVTRPLRAALRTINHELQSPILLAASAENLQADFSSRLNKDPAMPAAVGRRPRGAIILASASPDVLFLVFDPEAPPPACGIA